MSPLWPVSAALLAAALFGEKPWRRLRRRAAALGPAGPDLLCVGALVLVAAASHYPLLLGRAPLSWDHNFHLLKVVELERLLQSGRLIGWTDMEFAGYPFGLQYPFAAYVVVAALDALPAVSLTAAYAWSVFFLTVLLGVLAVYLAARLHLSRAAGVLAGLLALADPGGPLVGGYFWGVYIGSWASTASSSLVLVSLALLPGTLRRGSLTLLAGVGALIGSAVLMHPLALVLILASAGPLALAIWSSDPPLSIGAMARRSAVVGGAALAVCAFWAIPMTLAKPYFLTYALPPPSASKVWEDLLGGSLLRYPAPLIGISLCGVLLLARRGDAFSRFAAVFIPAAITLTTAEGLRFLGVYAGGRKAWVELMQVERIYCLVRPLCFIAAGHALAWTFASPTTPETEGRRGGRVLRVALCAVVAFALLLPGATLPGWVGKGARDLNPQDREDLEAALDRATGLVGHDERLALHLNGEFHSLVGPAALRGFKIVKIGYSPANVFSNLPDVSKPEVLQRLATTALLSSGAPPAPLDQFPLVERRGRWELRTMDKLPRAWIEGGPGQAVVRSWGDQEIRVSVQGAGATSRLRLMLGYHEGWREEGGAPLSTFDSLGKGMTALTPRNGEIVLRHRWTSSQWAGLAVSLVGLAVLGLLIRREWRQREDGRVAPRTAEGREPPPPSATGGSSEPAPLEPVACNLCGRSAFTALYDSPLRLHDQERLGAFIASTDRFDHYGRIVRCLGCGLTYTNPRPCTDVIACGYAEAMDADYVQEDAGRSMNAHMSLHTIKRFVARGRLLDVGCSTGYFLNAARMDFEASGLEPSRWAVAHARSRLGLDVGEGTLADVALPEASFDVVTLNDVIEHLPDPLWALGKIGTLLKPGGLLYLVTPDIASLTARLLRGRWWGLRPAHLYYFSPATLNAALERSGFEVVLLKSYGRVFTYGYWLSRLKNYPRWIFRTAGAVIGTLGIRDKFLYLDTRDSMEVCALKRVRPAPQR